MCRDLTQIGAYAHVDNARFRLLKKLTPGSYTFILPASREVPRRLLHPRRRTIGVRVPDHPVAQALLAELDEPLLSATLVLPGDEHPLNDPEEIRSRVERQVEAVLDSGACGIEPSTVVDMTGPVPEIVRIGKGAIESIQG
jgi:tRNA threonylcarbamoyl adenosine modification protein (Sua5/YciO/YrdC/YwlC family)